MNDNSNSGSGFSTFVFKFGVLVFVFGIFPVLLSYVVQRYNQRIDGFVSKQSATEDFQKELQEEVRVLTQEDASALQKINNFTAGEWYGAPETNYRIRYEQDNTFNEYVGNKKIGYGLWRAVVNHYDTSNNDFFKGTSAYDSVATTSDITGLYDEAAFKPDPTVVYFLSRTQFESGKKSDPIRYRILYISETKMVIAKPDGSVFSFERSL